MLKTIQDSVCWISDIYTFITSAQNKFHEIYKNSTKSKTSYLKRLQMFTPQTTVKNEYNTAVSLNSS